MAAFKIFLFAVTLTTLLDSSSATVLSISHYKYLGYKNVWHEGTQHISIDLENTTSTTEDSLRNACANECSLDAACDAFYLEDKADGNCHLVDEQGAQPMNRTVGHGFRKEDIYFVKTLVPGVTPNAITMDPNLLPPCDQDYELLSAADCAAFPAQAVTLNRCPFPINGYADSVSVRSDLPCDGEDRLLMCELQDGKVLSDVAGNTDGYFEPGMEKTKVDDKGAVINFNYARFVFSDGPRKLTRLIVRNANVYEQRMAAADVVITASSGAVFTQNVAFSNDTAGGTQGAECAAMINFEHAGTQLYKSVTQVELANTLWFGTGTGSKPRGFKVDIFTAMPEALP